MNFLKVEAIVHWMLDDNHMILMLICSSKYFRAFPVQLITALLAFKLTSLIWIPLTQLKSQVNKFIALVPLGLNCLEDKFKTHTNKQKLCPRREFNRFWWQDANKPIYKHVNPADASSNQSSYITSQIIVASPLLISRYEIKLNLRISCWIVKHHIQIGHPNFISLSSSNNKSTFALRIRPKRWASWRRDPAWEEICIITFASGISIELSPTCIRQKRTVRKSKCAFKDTCIWNKKKR